MIKHAWRRTYPDTRIISQQYCTFILRLSDKNMYKFVHDIKIQKKTVFTFLVQSVATIRESTGKFHRRNFQKFANMSLSLSYEEGRAERKVEGNSERKREEGQREEDIPGGTFRRRNFISFHVVGRSLPRCVAADKWSGVKKKGKLQRHSDEEEEGERRKKRKAVRVSLKRASPTSSAKGAAS